MSKHEVLVMKLDNIRKHPNADNLDIIDIWGYQCIVRHNQYKIGDMIIYIEPDFTIKLSRPEFSFLDTGKGKERERITTRKFRGEISYGLVIPAPKDSIEGDNVLELLEVERYEPPMGGYNGSGKTGFLSGMCEKGPDFNCPEYGLENYKKFSKLIPSGTPVIYTNKIHGSSARYVFSSKDDKFFCGSRTTWKKPSGEFIKKVMITDELTGQETEKTIVAPENAWYTCHLQNPWIETWCRNNPDQVLYGELYGPNVQGSRFHYGMKDKQYGFAVFDILKDGNWVDNLEVYFNTSGIETVKVLFSGSHDIEIVKSLAELPENFNDCGHVREGVVIKTTGEHRIALKWVSDQYYAIK